MAAAANRGAMPELVLEALDAWHLPPAARSRQRPQAGAPAPAAAPLPPPSAPPLDASHAPAACDAGERGEAGQEEPGGLLDDLCLLNILTHLDDAHVVQLRAVSSRLRALADVALERSFVARWRVGGVAAPPPAAPAYAAARAAVFVRRHRLDARESLAAVAVRHSTDVATLKRLNNLMSEQGMFARSHLYVPVHDAAAAAAGQRVAFVTDEHSMRRLVVVCGEGEAAPGEEGPRDAAAAAARARSREFVVAKLAGALQRALRIDRPTALFYVSAADCDIRLAIAKYEEDRRWERAAERQRRTAARRPR